MFFSIEKHVKFYQGDIIMDPELEELLHGSNKTRTKRNAIREKKRLWKTRIIPYKVLSHMSKNWILFFQILF